MQSTCSVAWCHAGSSRPGIEPVSPGLQAGLVTPGPPGKLPKALSNVARSPLTLVPWLGVMVCWFSVSQLCCLVLGSWFFRLSSSVSVTLSTCLLLSRSLLLLVLSVSFLAQVCQYLCWHNILQNCMNFAWISLVYILLSKDLSTAILKIIHSLSLASAEMSEDQSLCCLRGSSVGSVSPVLWDTALTLETTVHRIEYSDLWFFSSFTRRSYSHGESRGLYPWGCKELAMTEQLSLSLS